MSLVSIETPWNPAIREFRPHVMTTYDENGGYPHPDHIMCHTVSMAAFRTAGDHEAHPHAGEPWQPLKIYYNQTMSKGRIVTFHDAMEAAGLESPYAEWIKRWEDRGERTITTRVECSAYFAQRDQALLAHATQVDPDGTWFTVPLDMQQEIWPTEDYEAALSYVPVSPIRGRPVRRAGLPRGGHRDGDQHRAADRVRRQRVTVVNTPSTSVSPGLGGFLAFFLLAIALWLLMRNMNKRVRRMTYREEQEAARRAAEGASARGEGPVRPGTARRRRRPRAAGRPRRRPLGSGR